MKFKASKVFAFLVALLMVLQLTSVTAWADTEKIAVSTQALISAKLSDQQMLERGYVKVQVAYQTGADVYDTIIIEEATPVDHLDAAAVLWVKKIEESEIMAQIYNQDKDEVATYIKWDDVIIVLKNTQVEDEYSARSVTVSSTLDMLTEVSFGLDVQMKAELVNFLETDQNTFQWYYTEDGETYIPIENATEQTYEYVLDRSNWFYGWRVEVTILNEETEQVPKEEVTPEDNSGEADPTGNLPELNE